MDTISALAAQFMAEHNLTKADIESAMAGGKGPTWDLVCSEVAKLSPAELGIIAATGKSYETRTVPVVSLYHVHCGTYLGKYESGLVLIQRIATTALVAQMRELTKEPVPTK